MISKYEVDQIGFNPRRPYDAHEPDGYLESDNDFIKNNIELVIAFLESLEQRV